MDSSTVGFCLEEFRGLLEAAVQCVDKRDNEVQPCLWIVFREFPLPLQFSATNTPLGSKWFVKEQSL